MSDGKTFTVAGTSTKKGINKWRFANGTAAARTKALTIDGQTDIRLFDLPSPMTEDAAKAWVLEQGIDAPPVRVPEAKEPKAAKPAKEPKEAVKPKPAKVRPAETVDVNVDDRAKELHGLSAQHDTPWSELDAEAQATFLKFAEDDAAEAGKQAA